MSDSACKTSSDARLYTEMPSSANIFLRNASYLSSHKWPTHPHRSPILEAAMRKLQYKGHLLESERDIGASARIGKRYRDSERST